MSRCVGEWSGGGDRYQAMSGNGRRGRGSRCRRAIYSGWRQESLDCEERVAV